MPAFRLLRRVTLFIPALIVAVHAADDLTEKEIRQGHRARTLLAKPHAAVPQVERAEAAEGVQLVRSHPALGGIRTLETDGSEEIGEVIKRLRDTGLYDYVEPDFIRTAHVLPNDPRLAEDQWSLNNTGQAGGTPGAHIGAAAAWDIQREAPNVIVAVIDSGLLVTHEDIAANVWENTAERQGTPLRDDDGNGYIDDLYGIDATVSRTSTLAGQPRDVVGHGTHVSGIIGAVGDNAKGIVGVAWKTQILPLKFLGRFGGTVSNSIACIDYAIAKKAHIINASYGSSRFSQAEYDALKRARDAGIIVVVSAGNDNQEINDLPSYPAAYELDNIIAVAATTRQDKLASYSTYGSGLVELAAPGSSILSLGITDQAPYVTQSGTSMAAPHVSGALALLRAKYPDDHYRTLINRLLNSVDVLPALDHRVHTNGRLNLLRALTTEDTRPFNDDFARRAVVTGDVNHIRGSLRSSTLQPGEPTHGGVATPGGSLWWSWTAPTNAGQLVVDTAGSEFDTVVAVYTGSTLEGLQLVGANDDASSGNPLSRLTVPVTAGTTYTIVVGAKVAIPTDGAANPRGGMSLALTTIPVNDAFASAVTISGPSVTLTLNNAGATAEPGEPQPRRASGAVIGRGKTMWFKWTAPVSRRYHLSVSDEVIDPVVSVYTGSTLANLVQVTFNDDSDASLIRFDALARFDAIAGVTYYFCIDIASGTNGGRFKFSLSDADWQGLTFGPIYASSALGADGRVYTFDVYGALTAFDPDGRFLWEWYSDDLFDGTYGGSVAVGPDGTLYVGTYYGEFYAVTATGRDKWKFSTGGEIWAAPALAADGTVYVKSSDDQLYALDAEGKQKWKFLVPGDSYSSPVIGADGTIYIASSGDAVLYAINPDGTEKWRADLGSSVYASPAIGADGTLYLGNYDGRFFAIRPDGTPRWTFDTGSPLSGSAAIDARGIVYFGSYDKKLYALDGATGAKRWEYATGDIIRGTTPAIAEDGTVYIGSDDGLIHAVDTDGKLRRTHPTGSAILGSPLISAGRLYIASGDAKLHAFEIGANLARSPWPMHGHNVRRTGRAIDPLPGVPVISTQPVAASGEIGTPVTLRVAATLTGAGTLTYQWRVDNIAIPGATSPTLTLPAVQASHVGRYSVVVTGPGGPVLSQQVQLTATPASNTSGRLVNLAVRTNAGPGAKVLTVGLVLGGANTAGNKRLLIRAVGPALAAFGVTGTLPDPKLELYAPGGTTPLEVNDNWGGVGAIATLAQQVGAFAFPGADSKDAALIANRAPGAYTVQISGATAESGIALAEIYDATPPASFTATTPRLVNLSARTDVGGSNDILIAGFAIAGGGRTLLIRAVGPTLGVFGVTGALANPRLDLFASNSTFPVSSSDNWGTAPNAEQVRTLSASVGAFALPLESRDAVLLVTLPSGSYTAQLSGVANTAGNALVEVYEIP